MGKIIAERVKVYPRVFAFHLTMRSDQLLLFGLVLVLMCNALATEEGATEVVDVADYVMEGKSKAADITSKQTRLEHEAMTDKGLLPLPGMPKWAKVTKRLEGVSESECKTSCDGDVKCAGFQYVAAEQLCQMFKEPKKPDQKISLKKSKGTDEERHKKGSEEGQEKG